MWIRPQLSVRGRASLAFTAKPRASFTCCLLRAPAKLAAILAAPPDDFTSVHHAEPGRVAIAGGTWPVMQRQQQTYAYACQLALAVGVVVFVAGLGLVHLLAIVWARLYFYRRVSLDSKEEESLPGVSILKPLVGMDRDVYSNLESFFTMQYPRYELLFCLESEDDVVKMVVDTLMEKYPNVDARVFTHPRKHNVNPKVNNLMQGYEAAKYDLLLISDSGIRMLPRTLLDMVWCITRSDRVGLVHQMPFVQQRPGFDNVVHSVYFGGMHARIYIVANMFGVNCTTGMSCLMRKHVLDQLPGGLSYFGRYLAEDFFLAQHFYSQGYKVSLSHYPALQTGNGSVSSLRRRLIRWIQLRAAMIPHVVVLEPFADCLLSGLLGAWGLNFLFPETVGMSVYFLIHCLVWLLCDYALLLSCMDSGGLRPFSRVAYVCAWLLCACMTPVNVLMAQCQSEIEWRNKRFRLMWGGNTIELPPAAATHGRKQTV